MLAIYKALHKLAGPEGLPEPEACDWSFIDELHQRAIADAQKSKDRQR